MLRLNVASAMCWSSMPTWLPKPLPWRTGCTTRWRVVMARARWHRQARDQRQGCRRRPDKRAWVLVGRRRGAYSHLLYAFHSIVPGE